MSALFLWFHSVCWSAVWTPKPPTRNITTLDSWNCHHKTKHWQKTIKTLKTTCFSRRRALQNHSVPKCFSKKVCQGVFDVCWFSQICRLNLNSLPWTCNLTVFYDVDMGYWQKEFSPLIFRLAEKQTCCMCMHKTGYTRYHHAKKRRVYKLGRLFWCTAACVVCTHA